MGAGTTTDIYTFSGFKIALFLKLLLLKCGGGGHGSITMTTILRPLVLQLDADDAEPHLEEKEGQDEYSQLQMPVWPDSSLLIGRCNIYISISDVYPVAGLGAWTAHASEIVFCESDFVSSVLGSGLVSVWLWWSCWTPELFPGYFPIVLYVCMTHHVLKITLTDRCVFCVITSCF